MKYKFWTMSSQIIILLSILAYVFITTAQECGRNTITDDIDVVGPRINAPDTGGEVVAGRGSWPWLASLGRFRQGKWQHFCGGSLVSDRHVLTAAHCLVSGVTAIRLGDGDLDDDVGIQRRVIRQKEQHPKYKAGQPYYDVAVLTLDPPVDINSQFVRPICLPDFASDSIDEFDGDQMDVAGWGLTAKNGFASEVGQLRQVQQKVFKNSFCNASHTNVNRNFNDRITKYLPQLFTSNIMCAGYEFGGSGSCKGDSGGPLMKYTYENGPSSAKYVQQGIVQGGVGRCGSKDFPSIYVRVKDPEVFEFIKLALEGAEGKSQRVLAKELHTAAKNDDINKVRSLLDSNKDNLQFVNMLVENPNGISNTALDVASFNDRLEIVKLLVRKGRADPDIKDSLNFTPAYGAAQKGNFEVLRVLVDEANADINLRNGPDEGTVIMVAISNRKPDIVNYLIPKVRDINVKNNDGYSSLFIAAEHANLRIVQDLVFKGQANVNMKNGPKGWTAAMIASQEGALDILKFLIEKAGADPTIKADRSGLNALHVASYNGRAEIVRYLATQTNIDVNEQEQSGYTPLFVAALEGHADVVKILIEEGRANVEWRNGDKLYTALHIAAHEGFLDIVRYLVTRAGANVSTRTGDGRDTALTLAESNGHQNVANFLRRYS